MPDFTERFTGRAEAYSKYRPGYPSKVLSTLGTEAGLSPSDVVADIGSGTGILSELFLRNGNTVFGVEPNHEMRFVAESRLDMKFPKTFKSVRGRAEKTTLRSSSVDMVVVGQALHWFDIEAARREFSRILRPGGHLCVLYNDRSTDRGLMASYGRIVKSFHRAMPKTVPEINDRTLRRLFSNYKAFEFPNSQRLGFGGLLGRLLSASYAPGPENPTGRGRLRKRVARIFARYSEGGKVTLRYTTRLYLGQIR